MKWCSINTYRHTLTFDAVHDAEGRAQVCEPRGAQLLRLFAELTFCKDKHLKLLFVLKLMVILDINFRIDCR